MQRHPRYYPSPERFDPERFRPEQQKLRPKFTWFPFGHGSDTELQERSVFLEGVVTLAVLVQNWRFRLASPGKSESEPASNLRPQGRFKVVLEKR
jgi:cytochrome P450